jgi:chromate transporter
MGLLTDAQFNASIAIAQAAPGPNVLFVAAIGYQAAGMVGAALVLLAVLLPSTTVAYVTAHWGEAHREYRALRAFRAGVAPHALGLLLAGGWVLAADVPGWQPTALTAFVALVAWRTNVHTLVLIAVGAVAGVCGLI